MPKSLLEILHETINLYQICEHLSLGLEEWCAESLALARDFKVHFNDRNVPGHIYFAFHFKGRTTAHQNLGFGWRYPVHEILIAHQTGKLEELKTSWVNQAKVGILPYLQRND